MLRALHHRFHAPGQTVRSAESALWATGILLATLLAILILFLGVFATRAV